MGSDSEDVKTRTMAAIMAVWHANKPAYLERVELLARAAAALQAGALSPEARSEASGEAHKVAGAVGTFGYQEASRIAKDMERMLRGDQPLSASDGDRLAELAAELRRQLAT